VRDLATRPSLAAPILKLPVGVVHPSLAVETNSLIIGVLLSYTVAI